MKKNEEKLGPMGILVAFLLLIAYCIIVSDKEPEEKKWF